jgi:hypothetical protein
MVSIHFAAVRFNAEPHQGVTEVERAYVEPWLVKKQIGITRSKVSIPGIANYLRFAGSPEAINS